MLIDVLLVGTAARVAGAPSATADLAAPPPSAQTGTPVGDALVASGLSPTDALGAAEETDSIAVESLRRFEDAARDRAAWRRFGLAEGEYALVVVRRLSGKDDPDRLERVALALADLGGNEPVIFPADAPTRAQLAAAGRLKTLMAAGVRCIDPLRYLDLLSLKAGAGAVLTDSARVVEEARALGVAHFALPTDRAPAWGEAEAPPELPVRLPAARRRRDVRRVLGVDIDNLDMAGTVAACERIIDTRQSGQHVCINVAKLMSLRHDPELRRIVESCSLVSADGQPIVWASRLLGTPLPQRVAGIDLMLALLDLAARRGFRPYFVGARPEVLAEAMRRLAVRYPGLQMAGWRDGYFSEDEEPAVCANIRATRPDMLFVAMGSPQKEYFLGRNADTLGVPFVMGVGGALDVAAGETRRAPASWQRLGLEWFYRLLQEPRRLGRRYLTTNAAFVGLVVVELLRRRRER